MLFGYAVALPPALHRSMISMAQLARDRAYPPARFQDFDVSHTHNVHMCVQPVNVANEREAKDYAFMADDSTLGAKLRVMVQRSGRSYREIAKAAGYRNASSVQRYFSDDYEANYLPLNIAAKLAKGFEGSPVSPDEVIALSGVPSLPNAIPFRPMGPNTDDPADVPVYGTALGTLLDVDGGAVEQTYLNQGDIITYFSRPSALRGRTDIYGLFIQGSSMAPRFEEGEMTYAETRKPPKVGEDAVIYLVDTDSNDGEEFKACLIKRIVRRTSEYIELQQFNPACTFRVPAERVKAVHRVIPWGELLA